MASSTGRHRRDDVVATALRLLDEVGLPDLTMRRLAGALDVQASALYWHFPDKQTLLASVSDRIVARNTVARVEDAGGADDAQGTEAAHWTEEALAEARALRDALLAFRDGAELVASSLAFGLGGDEARRRLAASLDAGGFDPAIRAAAADALLHFLLGHVQHEQQRLQADALGIVAPGHGVAPGDAVAPGRAVAVSDAAAVGDAPGAVAPGAAFDFGIRLLLDGLAQHARA